MDTRYQSLKFYYDNDLNETSVEQIRLELDDNGLPYVPISSGMQQRIAVIPQDLQKLKIQDYITDKRHLLIEFKKDDNINVSTTKRYIPYSPTSFQFKFDILEYKEILLNKFGYTCANYYGENGNL